MMNCNCFDDWDHSLLVFNEVCGSYFSLWRNCYLTMRSFMIIYFCYDNDHDAFMHVFCFIDTSLSLNMWSWLSISAFAWEQARSKLGELICPFCIMFYYCYLLCFWSLFHLTIQFLCLFSLILQVSHEEGDCRQLEFWTGKGWNRDSYSVQLQMSWKFMKNYFGIYRKY